MKRLSFILTAAAGLVAAAAAAPAACEVFLLTNGARIEGRLLNPDESPRKRFIILTASGTRITLDQAQVKQILHGQPADAEYDTIRHKYPDTTDGHWALAEWCREHGLVDRREAHLKRIIELAPDHPEARAALGYTRYGGEWFTRDELMDHWGMVRFQGAWRYPQEIELLKREHAREEAEAEWLKKFRMWRGWLDGERAGDARSAILAIRDPAAAAALRTALENDERRHARLLYVEALGNIGTQAAQMALARAAMEDRSSEVRMAAIEELAAYRNPSVVSHFVGYLEDKENHMVQRAALALGSLQDPGSVVPLMGALVTTHKRTLGRGGGPGSISTTFGNGPGGSAGAGGLSMNQRPKVVQFQVRNQPVLDALVTITGRNYGFDEQAWRRWYSSAQQPAEVNLRRD